MPGSLTISGGSFSEPAGQRSFGPVTITGNVVVGETLAVPLVSGDNTFAIPTGAVACWIVPPPLGTVNMTVRTSANQADVGLPISPVQPFGPYAFPSALPTSLIINASAAQQAPLSIVFI